MADGATIRTSASKKNRNFSGSTQIPVKTEADDISFSGYSGCMEEHKSSVPVVAAVLALLPCLYLLSYALMLTPVRAGRMSGVGAQAEYYHVWDPAYRIESESGWIGTLFVPAHVIDRSLRRDYWSSFQRYYPNPSSSAGLTTSQPALPTQQASVVIQ